MGAAWVVTRGRGGRLGPLLHESNEVFENLAAAKQVAFERRTPAAGLCVRAERERVLQVLSNLLGNAIKFTPAGGRVVLAVVSWGSWAQHRVPCSILVILQGKNGAIG